MQGVGLLSRASGPYIKQGHQSAKQPIKQGIGPLSRAAARWAGAVACCAEH